MDLFDWREEKKSYANEIYITHLNERNQAKNVHQMKKKRKFVNNNTINTINM